jgi:hypothetical protein
MRWIKSIFWLVLVASFNSAVAIGDDYLEGSLRPIDYDTYIGIGYKQNWIKPKGEWKQLLRNEQGGFDVYLGWKFVPYFGVELGYEWTIRQPKSIVVPNNTVFMGVRNNTGTFTSMTGRFRFRTGHIDLNAFIPFKLGSITSEGIASIGIASIKPCLFIQTENPTATYNFSSQFTSIEGRSKAVFRVGLGIQTWLLENVGVRALWRFENTSVLRFRNSIVAYALTTRDVFHNGQSLFLGLLVKF